MDKNLFTNEKLLQKFRNQFDLVNYAIRLAENMIKTGRDPRVKTDNQNRAMQVLAEINCNKDQFDEIKMDELPFISGEKEYNGKEFAGEGRGSERKRARKNFSE